MPKTICHTCGSDFDWTCDEAFNKFGFGDGDREIMTEDVADVLRAAGYVVKTEPWGLHNITIASILKDGLEQIPTEGITFGYDNPRSYLPPDIIALLDRRLPEHGEVVS